jgi:hypothetical protein
MRAALLVVGGLLIAVGAALAASRAPGAAQALGLGLVLVLALLVERWRYRSPGSPGNPARRSGFVTTSERYQDPTSGELLQVEYNPATGERRYTRLDHSVNSLPDQR